MLTDCVDAKVGQFSFYTFQRVSIKCGHTAQMRIWSVQLLHILESEYKVTKDCADAKVGHFSLYTFQRGSIKC